MTELIQSNKPDQQKAPIADVAYDLTDFEINHLTKQLIAQCESSVPNDMPFVCFRIKGTSNFSNIARTIEGRVFTEELCDEPDRMAADFYDYENSSYFFLVVDMAQQMPAGTLRIIEHGESGFMTVNELIEHVNPGEKLPQDYNYEDFYTAANEQASKLGNCDNKISAENTWEVGTIAVLPQYRRSRNSSEDEKIASFVVSGQLYRSLYAGARENGIDGFVSMIDPVALQTLRSLGIPFYNLPNTKTLAFEDGSNFEPCFAVVPDFHQSMTEFAKSEYDKAQSENEKNKAKQKMGMIEVLLTGNGLDDMMSFRHNHLDQNSVN